MDVDATTVTECLHACGSFSCSAAAAAVAEMDSAAMAAETTAACGSSCFSSAAADLATTDAADDISVNSDGLAGKGGRLQTRPLFLYKKIICFPAPPCRDSRKL